MFDFTLSEAARFLGISPQCTRKAAMRGWLPHMWELTRTGRERRFAETDLVAYRTRTSANKLRHTTPKEVSA